MSYPDFTSNAGYGLDAMNNKTIFIGSGADIAAIVSPPTGKVAVCNATGSGFVIGVVYQYNGSAWVAMAGDIGEMMRSNIRKTLWINEPFPRHELWTKVTTGATVSNNDTDGGFQIATGTTLDNRSTVSKMSSARFTFGVAFTILGKIDISASTRLLFRYGVGMRPANDFSSTERHIGIEIDNNTDSSVNMFASSSDNTTVSSSDTGQVGTSVHTWRIDFLPGVSMKVYRDGSLVLTKTTNIPSSGDTGSGDETFTVVGQTRNTSSKTVKIEYVQVAGEEAQTF
jgi:hypothetical protein